jgi:hypothetical protein
MRWHPLSEVRTIAYDIYDALEEKYPNSFREDRQEIAEWKQQVAAELTYNEIQMVMNSDDLLMDFDDIRIPSDSIAGHRQTRGTQLTNRPKGAQLPHSYSACGNITSTFLLDFGSFRDVQRHRNGVIEMPLLTTYYGIHPWYLEQLPTSLQADAVELCKTQEATIAEQDFDIYTKQYYVAMGYMCYVRITQALPAFIYRMELRTNKTVHPTLRIVCQKEAAEFKRHYPNIALHTDTDLDDWDVRRGKQTITEKEAG